MKLDRLRRLMTLAFLSDKEHERLAALDAIVRILSAEEHDVHWLVSQLFDGPINKPMRERRSTMTEADYAAWPEMLEYLCRVPVQDRMRPREVDFVSSLMEQRARRRDWGPSTKQAQWLTGIYHRMRVTDV